jgi:pSer/pThr/pTyr-binding forkhead associated (FHA) protein
MPRLLVRSPAAEGMSLELKSGAYRIGRGYANDLQIDHPSVSTAHCELRLLSGSLLVRDLGSMNGTFIDRQRIHESALLFGQILQVGAIELMLEDPLRLTSGGGSSPAPIMTFAAERTARCCCPLLLPA